MKKQIGWFILKEDTEFTNTFECAAWYERVLVKAGRYPMEVPNYKIRETENGKLVLGHINMVSVNLSGVITSDEFGARFCGVPVGSYDNTKNKGKESNHIFRQYLYGVANAILHPENSLYTSDIYEYELLPGYEAKDYTFISPIDDEVITMSDIYEMSELKKYSAE